MLFFKYRNLSRWIIVIASFAIITLILWNTYVFFQKFKVEEQSKMDIWATMMEEINKNPLNENVNPVVDKVFTSEITNPMLIIRPNGDLGEHNNINENKLLSNTAISNLSSVIIG